VQEDGPARRCPVARGHSAQRLLGEACAPILQRARQLRARTRSPRRPHILQTSAAWARSKRCSLVCAFVDVVLAFYTALRQLAVEVDCKDEAVAVRLHTLGLPAESMQRPRERLEQPPVVAAAGVPRHVRQVISEGLTGTWFGTDGLRQVAATRRGTRPGDPYGDVVFNFVEDEVLIAVGTRLAEAGIVRRSPWDGACSPFSHGLAVYNVEVGDVAYVDDGLFLSHAPAGEAVAVATSIAAIADEEFQARGLRMDFGAGKSQAEVVLAGPGREKARRDLWAAGGPGASFQGPGGELLTFTFARQYIHLGRVASDRPSLMPEIARMRAAMIASVRPLRKRILCNPGIPRRLRGGLADVYAVSTLLCNAHVMRTFGRAEAGSTRKAAMLAYRLAGAGAPEVRPSDLEVLARSRAAAAGGPPASSQVFVLLESVQARAACSLCSAVGHRGAERGVARRPARRPEIAQGPRLAA